MESTHTHIQQRSSRWWEPAVSYQASMGTHGNAKRLACKHTHTYTHTSGPPAHQVPSWIFMGSLSHLPQGHQATLTHVEATSAIVAPC